MSDAGSSDQGYDVRTDRVRYEVTRIDGDQLDPDPIAQFASWLDAAAASGVREPNAMVLATVGADGRPRARTVLLRGYDERGFVFFTNYDSTKGKQLAANPSASVCFGWLSMHRQVIVEGTVERLGSDESTAYFASRPLESQAASAVSPQSQPIGSLDPLLEQIAELERVHPDGIPRPEHWGGYRLAPEVIEFWQGNVGRLHDRFRYRAGAAADDAGGWSIERLAP